MKAHVGAESRHAWQKTATSYAVLVVVSWNISCVFPNQNYNSFNLSVFSGTSCPLISLFNHGQIFNKSTTEEETHCAQAARYQPDTAPRHPPRPRAVAPDLPCPCELHHWTPRGGLWATLPRHTCSSTATWRDKRSQDLRLKWVCWKISS